MSRTRRLIPTALAAGALLLTAVPATVATAAPSSSGCENRNINDKVDKFLACLSVDDALGHLAALQAIADDNGDTRVSGTAGYDLSVDYVAGVLEDAGIEISRESFEFVQFIELFAEVVVDGVVVDADTIAFSPAGSVTSGDVVAVDLDLGLGNASSSACEATDFDGIDLSGPADIVVAQRGACSFALKAFNAQTAGAEAVVIFNQGNTEERQVKLEGTLGGENAALFTIPVFDTDYFTGLALLDAADVSVSADTLSGVFETENIIAEIPGNNDDNVVMAGAHLDSVGAGPGIQDNGSGSAAILAVAVEMATNKKFTPENTVRFGWWGAEESGLIGSTEYVNGLSPEELDRIALYLNFDMIASPNFVFGVYDADTSTFPAPAGVPIPEGSEQLEDLFEAYYSSTSTPYDDSQFSGRSDYQAFINNGIPASGLFTGAEVLKTEEQQSIWGGTAGEQYDQCYHLACDTFDNVSVEALEVNLQAVGYAVFSVALDTSAVNGVEGREVRGDYDGELDGPRGTRAEGGGGLAEDHDHDHSMGEPE